MDARVGGLLVRVQGSIDIFEIGPRKGLKSVGLLICRAYFPLRGKISFRSTGKPASMISTPSFPTDGQNVASPAGS
jgi:hypothetical protein